MSVQLPIDIDSVKGFLDPTEGAALFQAALDTAHIGPALEIGSYCGKSTIYLGTACQQAGQVLYALDHHRGSEEHQLGEEYHDAQLYDAEMGLMDTFREFRKNMRAAKLEDTVVPIVAPSKVAGRAWSTQFGLVFIDGGHSMEAAQNDYDGWAQWVRPGGALLIHDVFPDPADGGRPPYEIYKQALESGRFTEVGVAGSLRVLQRTRD